VFLKEYWPCGPYWYLSRVIVLMNCSDVPVLLFW
jgi:hypothetical protein